MPQYYCHACSRSFDLADSDPVNCTRCHGEFVEIVNRPAVNAAAMPHGYQILHQIGEMLRNGINQEIRQPQQQQPEQQQQEQPGDRQVPEGDRAAAGGEAEGDAADPTLVQFINGMFSAEPRLPAGNLTFSFQVAPGVGIQINATRDTEGGPHIPQFVGNDGDGRIDMDAAMQEIIAQLQFPEAATGFQRGFPEGDIEQFLPMTKVTKEQVDQQCSTCFDTFKLAEDVGVLDCKHIFHRPCIVPWLKTKNSCPVCRQKVCMTEWKKNHQKRAQEAMLDLD